MTSYLSIYFNKTQNFLKFFNIFLFTFAIISILLHYYGSKKWSEEDEMSRRGDNIRKRKDGRWEGRYVISRTSNGINKYRSVYGKTYSEVKNKLQQCVNSKEWKTNICSDLVNTIARNWLEGIKNYKKYATYVKYDYIYNIHIKHHIGEKHIYDITTNVCLELISLEQQKGINNGKPLSNSIINSIKNVLTQIVKYGTKNYSFKINDKRNIKRPTNQTTKTFLKIEQEKILSSLLCDMNSYNLGIYICLFTGLRLGEICALRKSDINLIHKTITINQTVQRIKTSKPGMKTELIISTPKTENSNRIIPISDMLLAVLKEYMTDSSYVVNGEKVMEPRTYQYYFKRLLNSLSIENKNFHALRHTFATNCINCGMDPKCLSELLGHSDVKTTLNKYVHPSMEQKRNQINSLSIDYGNIHGQ